MAGNNTVHICRRGKGKFGATSDWPNSRCHTNDLSPIPETALLSVSWLWSAAKCKDLLQAMPPQHQSRWSKTTCDCSSNCKTVQTPSLIYADASFKSRVDTTRNPACYTHHVIWLSNMSTVWVCTASDKIGGTRWSGGPQHRTQ